MSGSLVRLQLEGQAPEVPESLIGKLPPGDAAQRALLDAMKFFEREVSFYRTLAAATPVDTPRCYFADIDPGTGHAFLLLEDLAPARNGDTVAGGSVDEVTSVLLALALMHARWWQDRTLGEQSWTRLPSMLAPSAQAEVFEQAWPLFVDKLSPSDVDASAAKEWISRELHGAATTLLETGPRTLIHNDVQPDNLFFIPQAGRPVVFLDWQLATYGRCVVDVACAIRSTLDIAIRRRVEPALLRRYHRALVEAGVQDYPFEQCQADYQLATVLVPGRLASAVGLTPTLHAHPGAFWDTVFPRLCAR